jgi:hypothetical protein
VALTLPGERFVYDIRAARPMGKQTGLSVQLDPYEPTILSVSPGAMPVLTVSGPRTLRPGITGTFRLGLTGRSPAVLHVFHVDVVDPSGAIVPHYSGNIAAPNGRATLVLPLALNDKTGMWEIRVKDLLSGHVRASTIEVSADSS